MLGTIVIRTLLVIALIVTAHTIKPFSTKNIAQHILLSTRSFAFVLPEGTRSEFDHANSLALSLSKSLFTDDLENASTSDQFLAPEGFLASSQPQVQRAAKIWPPDEPVKPGRKSKPPVKRSAPAKRINKAESHIAVVSASETSLSRSITEQDEELETDSNEESEGTIEPVILPAISDEIATVHTLPINFLVPPDRNSCKNQEQKMLKMIAKLVVPKKPQAAFQFSVRPKTVAPECEGQKPDSGEPELVIPESEAPEIEELRLEVTEKQEAKEPEKVESETPTQPLCPLKCPH